MKFRRVYHPKNRPLSILPVVIPLFPRLHANNVNTAESKLFFDWVFPSPSSPHLDEKVDEVLRVYFRAVPAIIKRKTNQSINVSTGGANGPVPSRQKPCYSIFNARQVDGTRGAITNGGGRCGVGVTGSRNDFFTHSLRTRPWEERTES
jgi:hypothetical protein